MSYSIIIKNGTLIDGSGEKPRQADIGIKKEKIVKIGDLKRDRADLILDAKDLYVVPGFIDLTTHSDKHWTIFSHPNQENFIKQGITTAIGGHGGCSLAPIIKKESVEILEKWVDISQVNINWQSMKEFFANLEKRRLTINFGTFVGYENLRENVLSNTAEEANKEKIIEMNELLEKNIKEGAFGLSINFKTNYTRGVREKEILNLLHTVAKNKSLSTYHIQNEGLNLLPSVSKLVGFLRETNAKGHICHFKALGHSAWEDFKKAMDIIEQAINEKINITCDFFPHTSTGSNLISLLPIWMLTESRKNILKLLKEKETKQSLIQHLESLTLHYDKMIIASAGRSQNCIGKSIADVSKDAELKEEEVILALLETNELRISIFNNIISEKNIEKLASKNYSMASSDGIAYDFKKIQKETKNFTKDLPHPRSFGTFPKFFQEFVKDKEILTWEEAVYKTSGLPAETIGLKKRGQIKKGYYADITIIDPMTIRDLSTYKKPYLSPQGIEYVFVNGALTLANREMTGKKEGRVVKKGEK